MASECRLSASELWENRSAVLLQHGRYTPLRLQAVLETALRESLEEIEIGSRRLVLSDDL